MKRNRCLLAVPLLAILLASFGHAQILPIQGEDYERWHAAQDVELQRFLMQRIPGDAGIFVTGPLHPVATGAPGDMTAVVRIVCPDLESLHALAATLDSEPSISSRLEPDVAWLNVSLGEREAAAMLLTVARLRWLIWHTEILESRAEEMDESARKAWVAYATAVAGYLNSTYLDEPSDAPIAADYGVDPSLDFYAPPPDYVIQGYANYKGFLREHADISTDFAHGILAFIPTDSLLDAFRANAPQMAFPNKEQAALQHELRKFFDRGGNMQTMRTLTAETFASLQPGEYFWGMNVAGQIRFGRELLREEVKRIEAETGRKAPRANHAYLFPGEPLLTAGAFWIEADPEPRLAEVTAGSGHYFYSNIQPTIREDIAEHSNEYVWTLGHFFRGLDSLGIAYDDVLIRKY